MDNPFPNESDNNPFLEAIYEDRIQEAINFLDQGYDINSTTHSGSTALHIASQRGNLDLVNLLISRGINYNLLTIDGWTALNFAAQKGYLQIVNALIKAGININQQGFRYRRTALHYSADQGKDDVIIALLNAGANPNISDISGNKPKDVANKKGYITTAKLFDPQTI